MVLLWGIFLQHFLFIFCAGNIVYVYLFVMISCKEKCAICCQIKVHEQRLQNSKRHDVGFATQWLLWLHLTITMLKCYCCTVVTYCLAKLQFSIQQKTPIYYKSSRESQHFWSDSVTHMNISKL